MSSSVGIEEPECNTHCVCHMEALPYSLASSANNDMKLVIWFGMSFIKTTNKIGPMTLPCGTPLATSDQLEAHPITTTRCLLPLRNGAIQLRIFPAMPRALILLRGLWCVTESKAFVKSRYMVSCLCNDFQNLACDRYNFFYLRRKVLEETLKIFKPNRLPP